VEDQINNAANPQPEESTAKPTSGYKPESSVDDAIRKSHAETARTLAVWFIGILCGSVLVHYICLMFLIFYGRDYGVKVLEDLFHAWLPVLAGLAGSAATYYFTTKTGKN
jgi:hypothetical protein